jgi:hypothetical protein
VTHFGGVTNVLVTFLLSKCALRMREPNIF